MVIHPADCSNCTSICEHYLVGIMDNDQTHDLKRRHEETLQKLTAMHQKLNEAQVKLAEAQQDCAHLMGANNKPHRQQNGLEEEHHISASRPSLFQLP